MTHILDLMFADDCALVAETPELLQELLGVFVTESQKLGLRVNEEKTEVMFINTPGIPININGKQIKTVKSFKYLGSALQANGQINEDIQHRITGASLAFRNLHSRVWKPHEISLKTKLLVYETVVLSTLLYSSECWTVTANNLRVLNAFHLRCLRTICRVKWTERTPDEEVLERTGMFSIEKIIQTKRLRWAGHLSRMEESRVPHQVAFSELKEGKRPKHKPKKRWIDQLNQDLKNLHIDPKSWRSIAADRLKWRSGIKDLVKANHTSQIEKKKQDRQERHDIRSKYSWKCPVCNLSKDNESGRQFIYRHIKEVHEDQMQQSNALPPNLECTICNLTCKSKCGFLSHLRNKHNSTTEYSTIRPVKVQNPNQTNDEQPPPFTSQAPENINPLQCTACGRTCKTSAGLKSHQRNAICREKLDTMESSDTMDS